MPDNEGERKRLTDEKNELKDEEPRKEEYGPMFFAGCMWIVSVIALVAYFLIRHHSVPVPVILGIILGLLPSYLFYKMRYDMAVPDTRYHLSRMNGIVSCSFIIAGLIGLVLFLKIIIGTSQYDFESGKFMYQIEVLLGAMFPIVIQTLGIAWSHDSIADNTGALEDYDSY